MSVPVTAIVKAEFADPEEGLTATVDRLVMAASYWRVSSSALRNLVHLTALACGSDKVVSMTLPTADLDELVRRGLIRCGSDRPDTVVLI